MSSLNFIVFAIALYQLFGKYVMRTLAERRQRIEQGLRDAEQARRDRESAEQERVAALNEARREANEIINRAQRVAQETRDADIAATREELERMRVRASAEIDAEKQRAIADHIPWTRRVSERKTSFAGQTVDLIPHILAHRDQFVLKPNDDYGGKGIVLGWDVDHETWAAAMQQALAEPYIVQKRVKLQSEPYPSMADGRVEVFDRMHYGVSNDLAALCLILLAGVLIGGCLFAVASWWWQRSSVFW